MADNSNFRTNQERIDSLTMEIKVRVLKLLKGKAAGGGEERGRRREKVSRVLPTPLPQPFRRREVDKHACMCVSVSIEGMLVPFRGACQGMDLLQHDALRAQCAV
jgi:hypothetical protein